MGKRWTYSVLLLIWSTSLKWYKMYKNKRLKLYKVDIPKLSSRSVQTGSIVPAFMEVTISHLLGAIFIQGASVKGLDGMWKVSGILKSWQCGQKRCACYVLWMGKLEIITKGFRNIVFFDVTFKGGCMSLQPGWISLVIGVWTVKWYTNKSSVHFLFVAKSPIEYFKPLGLDSRWQLQTGSSSINLDRPVPKVL